MPRKNRKYLKRRESFREPKRKFYLFSEGKTEKDYFLALQRHCDALIDVVVENPGSNPKTLALAAIEFASKEGLGRDGDQPAEQKPDSYEEFDQVWIVFDRDEHPPAHVNDALQKCQSRGIGIARFNPCFELWLILHEEDYDRAGGRHAVQAHYRTLRQEYDPSRGKTANWPEVLPRIRDAERRAKSQLRRREEEGNAFGEPSTTVCDLTEAIHTAAEQARGRTGVEERAAETVQRRPRS